MFKRLSALLCILLYTVGGRSEPLEASETATPGPSRQCINLGNMLEAPTEGAWGLRVQDWYLTTIAEAGFDSVRVPVRWSAHAGTEAPYTITPAFMDRVQQVVDWSLDAGLHVILNVHHYEELMQNPNVHGPRLIALWDQIGARFADYPDTLLFELLNEPNGALDARAWNALYPQLIAAVRETNPTRTLVLGGPSWNSLGGLDELVLPDDRTNLIATFHYYEPFRFTHQGAEWVANMNSDSWLGTIWGTRFNYQQLDADFERAAAWAAAQGVPLLLGEFGAYSRADMTSRRLYTRAVREAAEANGIGWCYWEFASGFGIFDANQREFNPLYRALIPQF